MQPAADKLFKEKKIDLLVETFKDSPKGDIEKLKAMTAAERENVLQGIRLRNAVRNWT